MVAKKKVMNNECLKQEEKVMWALLVLPTAIFAVYVQTSLS